MKSVHLMGIGGTGMVALAGLFVEKGWRVRGSDKDVYPPASDELARLGVEVRNGFAASNLEPAPDLVVVGNVIGRANPEAQALLSSGLRYLSMPGALAEYFLPGRRSLVVAGTHGKSTGSSLLAWVLESAGLHPGFFIGGFPLNFGWGYRAGSGRHFVLEGDEYDTAFFEKTPKFLHYRPDDVIVTSVEFDHADIYRDLAHVSEQFDRLLSILPADARILACGDHATVRDVCRRSGRDVVLYGLGPSNRLRAVNLEAGARGMTFDLEEEGRRIVTIDSPLIGRHNVANAAGCVGMALAQGISPEACAAGVASFKGVRRRQEFLGDPRGIRIYDDFAHHPTAIAETLEAFLPLAERSGGRLWAVFEPRSNTLRRRVFQEALPASFASAHETLIAPVFRKADTLAAEETLDPADAAAAIVRRGGRARCPSSYDEIVSIVATEARSGDLVVFMSNGAFGGVPRRTLEALA